MWLTLSRRIIAEQARTQVEALSVASAEGTPYVIDSLRLLRPEALPLLRERFQDENSGFQARLRLACGLAALGEGPEDFLLDAVTHAPAQPAECVNLVHALQPMRKTAADALCRRFRREADPQIRLRLAVVQMYLGVPKAAPEMLALAPDPRDRTAFIHGFPSWHAGLQRLAVLLRDSSDGDLRSGLCAGLALTEPRLLRESAELMTTFQEIFTTAPDPATHSAASLVLARCGVALPESKRSAYPRDSRRWFVNRHGMTMLAVPSGKFVLGDPDPQNIADARPHAVTLTRPFHICDREVSVELFRAFMEDPAYPKQEKPDDWPGPDPALSPHGNCPVQQVSWTDAVLFCNWLSDKEQRTRCYRQSWAEKTIDGKGGKIPEWQCRFDADGYRLPTEAEWEYAARAGSTTNYSFGNEENLLPHYANFSSNTRKPTSPGASFLPNGWGLFDMHGNVWEWCWDRWSSFGSMAQTDPTGPEQPAAAEELRVHRGGGVANSRGDWRSAARGRAPHAARYFNVGFRVVCGAAHTPKN